MNKELSESRLCLLSPEQQVSCADLSLALGSCCALHWECSSFSLSKFHSPLRLPDTVFPDKLFLVLRTPTFQSFFSSPRSLCLTRASLRRHLIVVMMPRVMWYPESDRYAFEFQFCHLPAVGLWSDFFLSFSFITCKMGTVLPS